MKKCLLALIIIAMMISACGGKEKAADTPAATAALAPTPTTAPASSTPAPAHSTVMPATLQVEPQDEAETPLPPPAPSTVPPTATPPPPDVPSEEVFFSAEGDANIAATLFGEGEIAVILLHQGRGNATQKSWHPFASFIAERGFAALTVTFRGRGQSEGTLIDDYWLEDTRGAVRFLQERGYSRLVCIGAGIWGAEPCLRLASEVDLVGLVVISNPMSVGERISAEELAQLTIPKLFIYSENDGEGVAEGMTEMHRLSAEPKELIAYEGAARGTDLFRSAHADDLSQQLLIFLEEIRAKSANTPSSSGAFTTRPLPTLKPPITSDTPPANPSLGDTWVRPSDGAVMVYVPAGEFMMGSSQAEIEDTLNKCQRPSLFCDPDLYEPESPQHTVTLDGFWIDQFEVTNAQFVAYLNKFGNWREGGGFVIRFGQSYCRIQEGEDEYWVTEAAADHPVVMVSGYGAEAYCEWVGARLPTEAEWEYAARSPQGYVYPWGNQPPTEELTRYNAGSTVSVGSYPDGVSWCGAHDMAGNVWEWTSDWFGRYPDGPQENPTGPASGTIKVLRGGGWHSSWQQVRSTFRLHDTAPSSVNG